MLATRRWTPTFVGVGALSLTAVALVSAAPRGAPAAPAQDVQALLAAAHAKHRGVTDGANADYIPALAKVDSKLFGIALVTVDGQVFEVGDIEARFSIQSISKVFTLARVLQDLGEDAVIDNMGVDATGQVFNSIEAIEQYKGHEMNAFVNPGAIAATSMVRGEDAEDVLARVVAIHSAFAGRELDFDVPVMESELATNQRNQAIAMLMHAYGRIEADPLQACEIYTKQCALSVNARDLAVMGATLANGGKNPLTGEQVVDPRHVKGILAVMATAGLYDDSGKWLFATGLPAKSGVGGGIVAVSPGKFGIAAFSPPLDAAGNSVRAQLAIREISDALGGNPYDVAPR
ncbi:MAG TPA: glutaminase A [Planctomycetota bacterium]|nr:glutaminase A [Planctomycetota bacterium]